jgi:hypothetical protein
MNSHYALQFGQQIAIVIIIILITEPGYFSLQSDELRVGLPRFHFRAGGSDISLLHSFLTAVHATCSMGTRGYFLGVKRPGCEFISI